MGLRLFGHFSSTNLKISYFLKTQNISPKKFRGIEIASPEIAAMFADINDLLSKFNTNFPTKTFVLIVIP